MRNKVWKKYDLTCQIISKGVQGHHEWRCKWPPIHIQQLHQQQYANEAVVYAGYRKNKVVTVVVALAVEEEEDILHPLVPLEEKG